MQIVFSKHADKVLNKVDNLTRARLLHVIDNIPTGDIKWIHTPRALYRLRIGGWRVIFSYEVHTAPPLDIVYPLSRTVLVSNF